MSKQTDYSHQSAQWGLVSGISRYPDQNTDADCSAARFPDPHTGPDIL